jgi:tetratricopeptide (TPR) repeat protein
MKKVLLSSTFLMAFVAFSAFGQNGRKFFKTGEEFIENQKYADAIAQFTKAIEAEPSNADYYYARGSAFQLLLRYDESVSDFEKALVFNPKDVNVLIDLGTVYNKTGNFEAALRLLDRASHLDKRNQLLYTEKVKTLTGLERYDQALKVADTAILIKDNALNHYLKGQVFVKLNNDLLGQRELEKAVAKDKKMPEPRLALAELFLRNNKLQEALEQCNTVISYDDRNTDAYLARSKVYMHNLNFPDAINDLSKNILIDPGKTEFYKDRGDCYQKFNQHNNAISDYTKYISLKPDDPDAFFARAKSFEEILDIEKAMEDYNRIIQLSEFNIQARKMLRDAQARLYELNRENIPPDIFILNPVPAANDIIEVKGDNSSVLLGGKIKDKSRVKSLLINNKPVSLVEKDGAYEFLSDVSVEGIGMITLKGYDDYDNERIMNYSIRRTEINPPRIAILAPYASDDGQVYLDNNSPNLFIQGKISDESKIKSIFIEGVTASYAVGELNPSFTATIDVLNKSKIVVDAEDIYGNHKISEFRLNREGAVLAENNPMGKTWVIFIENSKYSTFASLEGPLKDVNLMMRALSDYQIHNVIHKQDMDKAGMEKFFSIELRDLIKSNQVKSLLIWYAGHGKFINDVGYWIPVDARRDEEFTYFNINILRASMESYLPYLTHTLVVTDACESGPSFYQAMREDEFKPRSCDDWKATQFKSSQVFSSAGQELAVDDSQFTRTFATSLANNPKACIPIEEIVVKVSKAVGINNQQRPKFGKITGLKDEDGTFFFIAK